VGQDPSTIWFDWIDEFRQVSDRTSLMMARRLAREEGILAGGSTGLNVALAIEVARELDDPGALVVTILCDTGERYLSKISMTSGCRRIRCSRRPDHRAELLERRNPTAPPLVSVAPPRPSAGAEPDEHLGVSQIRSLKRAGR